MEGTKRNVTLLAACQGLLITNLTIFMLVGALVAHSLLDAKELATLPMTAFWLGGALATIPASMLMKNIGRRNGFSGRRVDRYRRRRSVCLRCLCRVVLDFPARAAA